MLKAHHLPDATNGELVRYARAAERTEDHDLLREIHREANTRVDAAKDPHREAQRAYSAAGGKPGRIVRGPERDELVKAGKKVTAIEAALRRARGRKFSGAGPF